MDLSDMDLKDWKPSRFNMLTRTEEGTLLVFNSFSTAFMQFEGEEAEHFAHILDGEPVEESPDFLETLAREGFIVPRTADELERARKLHESLFEHDDRLRLTLLPTENCNFRCIYCYEEHTPKRMSPELISSLVRLVRKKAPTLNNLGFSWFGGEPLLAMDIIEELTQQALEICKEHHIEYSSGMVTNGYLLTDKMADRCFSAQISRFQITLDGPAETHDTLRVLAGGGGTFDTIFANLQNLRRKKNDFQVKIRVNFTPDTISRIPDFMQFLKAEFGGDSRFAIYFHPVGQWGGKQDHLIKTCDRKTEFSLETEFMTMALQEGFTMDYWKDSLQIFGSACYAADPYSFAIGTDGTVYKCTVAFLDPTNQIGKITPDGSMNIDQELHNLWIRSGEETDTECQLCAFRPVCQGNRCPLTRLQGNRKPCPKFYTQIDKCLPLLAAEARGA